MKAGDIVRVSIQTIGKQPYEWDDEIGEVGRDDFGNERCILRGTRGIIVYTDLLTVLGTPIPAGTMVEMWNGGPQYDGGARRA